MWNRVSFCGADGKFKGEVVEEVNFCGAGGFIKGEVVDVNVVE